MRLARLRTAALATALALFGVTAAGAEITGAARVVDGDTLDVGSARLRLYGIDAPELAQSCATADGGAWACGTAAAARLGALTQGVRVTCEPIERDRYNRIVAVCDAGGRDLGGALVAEGLAWAFLRYSDDYAPAEDAARGAGRGVWQAPTQTAWDYRAGAWQNAAGAAQEPDCPIKGNVSQSGERIYHTPWSRDYARVQINPAKGERWFCDEAAAQAAGWRPPR